MLRHAHSLGVRPRVMHSIALRTVLWSLLGARLFHLMDHASFYVDVPFQAFYVWNGGLSLWGALIIGGSGALWHAKRNGARVPAFSDALTLAGLATLLAGRFGDFLAGERLGMGTSLPWAVTYVNERSVAFSTGPTHPVALYEAFVAMALLVGLIRFRGKIQEGWGVFIAFAGYSLGRLAIGFVTVDQTMAKLDASQWVAIAILIVIGIFAVRSKKRSRSLGNRTRTQDKARGENT